MITRILPIVLLILLSSCSIFRPAPPGTVKVDDQEWYMDQAEIRNHEWAEYLFWLRHEFSEDADVFQQALPNKDVWESVYSTDGRPYGTPNIFTLQRNRDFPVVGISYEQAKHFCQWRGNRVRQNSRHNVVYQLPTAEQYNAVVERYGFRDIGHTNRIIPRNELPVTPDANFSGLCVNVSEMTRTEGKAIGGNWRNPSSDCPVIREYDNPENWLGFRCVAERR